MGEIQILATRNVCETKSNRAVAEKVTRKKWNTINVQLPASRDPGSTPAPGIGVARRYRAVGLKIPDYNLLVSSGVGGMLPP